MSMCDLCSDELGFFDECDFRDCHKRKGGINKMSGWISVKDRLPEKYDDYITYDEYGITAITHYNMQGFFSKNGTIIHWMPLPEPPK